MFPMTERESQQILASLEKGSEALLGALRGVTDESAIRIPGPGKWSILQCVEHVAIAEDYLFSLITASTHSEMPFINQQREVFIATRGTDRSNRRDSPPETLPRGRFSTLHEALQGFLASRERTIKFVDTTKEDLRSLITSHPLLGTANCHEVLLLMAVHPARHAQQIEESKTATAS
jgi:hypothetical protein